MRSDIKNCTMTAHCLYALGVGSGGGGDDVQGDVENDIHFCILSVEDAVETRTSTQGLVAPASHAGTASNESSDLEHTLVDTRILCHTDEP